MLSVEHVTKRYGKFTALEDISLTFDVGVYGLLAPNGAGKTTLLKLLTTLLFPSEGKILWNGEEIVSMKERYRELVGYLPQHFGYYKNYTPRQFLKYMAALQGVEKKDMDKRVDELLEFVAMKEHADEKMKKFSGGMVQRVGIAQALINDPKILILDEPTAGLDPKERVRFRNLIHSLASDRIVILSTHIVSDIETIAGQIIMLNEHKVSVCDSPEKICGKLSGLIYEVPEGTVLPADAFVLSERQTESGTVLRIAALTPVKDAVKVSPNLEDAFLYIYRDAAGEV